MGKYKVGDTVVALTVDYGRSEVIRERKVTKVGRVYIELDGIFKINLERKSVVFSSRSEIFKDLTELNDYYRSIAVKNYINEFFGGSYTSKINELTENEIFQILTMVERVTGELVYKPKLLSDRG